MNKLITKTEGAKAATGAGIVGGISAVVGSSMGIAGGFGAIVATVPFALAGALVGGSITLCVAVLRRRRKD